MPLQYLAGQRLTADALQRAVPDRIVLGADKTVTSSTTLSDTDIAITVDDVMVVDLSFRWQSLAGGIRWAWSTTGSVTINSRVVGSAGQATAGTPEDLTTMRWRAGTTATTSMLIAHFSTGNAQRGQEQLVVEGSGILTFRIAQETSNASATTLFAESYAVVSRLGS
jgi:hypothetical protein